MTQKFIEETKRWYKTIRKVYCPVLKSDVIFNSKGLYHLRYNGLGHARTKEEYLRRLSLLSEAIRIINSAQSIYNTEARVIGNKTEIYLALKPGSVEVVLRKTGSGPIIFYSVF